MSGDHQRRGAGEPAVQDTAPGPRRPIPIVARPLRREGTLPFGKYLISRTMGPRYLAACRTVARIAAARAASVDDVDAISGAKGMYNRVLDQSSPDWEAVRQLVGAPDRAVCHLAAQWLKELRRLAKEGLPVAEHCDRAIGRGVAAALGAAAIGLERAGFGCPDPEGAASR